jgi:hypothetical protein
MKRVTVAASVVAASILAAAGTAQAHGSGGRFIRTTMLVPKSAPQAPAYVERDDDYWYFSPPLGAYYPDVAECPEPWVPVSPR